VQPLKLEATTSPKNNVDEWKQIQWSGDSGDAVQNSPNRRKLSLAASKKYHIEAKLGGVSDSLDVWVLRGRRVSARLADADEPDQWPPRSLPTAGDAPPVARQRYADSPASPVPPPAVDPDRRHLGSALPQQAAHPLGRRGLPHLDF
jgi:hypothetical protein